MISKMAAGYGQLRWRCRRGMRELDVVLQRYLEDCYPQASAGEQQAFEALLQLPDPQLLAYLLGTAKPAEPELINVIASISRIGA